MKWIAWFDRDADGVITDAGVKRAHVHVRDFERAGVNETLARRHFTDAFARARLIEPALDALAEAGA